MNYFTANTIGCIQNEQRGVRNIKTRQEQRMSYFGYGIECDIWSWGVVFCELIGGFNPFHSQDVMQTYDNILRLNINWPKNIDEMSRDLLS